MSKFINKSKYEVLAVRVDSIEDGRRIQDLCFDNGILWAGDRGAAYFDNTGYIYINLRYGSMLRSNQLDLLYLSAYRWDTKEYGIEDIYKIERIIKNGEKPNYSPRKILKESFDIKNYPYREIGFRVFTKEHVIKIINFFYDNYKIENRNTKDEIIKEILDVFHMAIKYRILTIDFHLEHFDIIDNSYMEHKKLYGFDPVVYTMDDLIKFQVVPNYKPKKRLMESFNLKTYPYEEMGFEVYDKDDVIKVINLFYDKYQIENKNSKNKIIEEILELFFYNNNSRLLIIQFKTNTFDISSKSSIDYKIKYGTFDPIIYNMNDLIKFQSPNYTPKRKRLLESTEFTYPYKKLIIKVTKEDSNSTQQKLFDLGCIWNTFNGNEIIKVKDFFNYDAEKTEHYIYVTVEDKRLTQSDRDASTSIYHNNSSNEYEPQIFTSKDIQPIRGILETGRKIVLASSMYKPRKRILESINTDVKETNYFKKYSTFVAVFDTDIDSKEFDKIRLLLNDNFNVRLREYTLNNIYSHCAENQFYIVIKLENESIDWAWGRISSLYKYNEKSSFSRIHTIDDINTERKINNILDGKEILPAKDMYKPKRFKDF